MRKATTGLTGWQRFSLKYREDFQQTHCHDVFVVFSPCPWYNIVRTQKGVADMRSQQEVNRIVRQLCSDLKPLFPQSSMEAILFGSYARGEADAESDIDVMVLVDSSRQDISQKTQEISSVAADLLLSRGVMVSPIVENRRYFQDNIGLLPFYRNIAREGVRYNA